MPSCSNWAWNEAFAATPIYLTPAVPQMQWKHMHGDIFLSLFSGTLITSSLSVFSRLLCSKYSSSGPQHACNEKDPLLSHIYSYTSAGNSFSTDECAVKTETFLNEHILIINSPAALLFFQEPWNQTSENTIPALITDFTYALSPPRLLNPTLLHSPLFTHVFSPHGSCSEWEKMIIFCAFKGSLSIGSL